MLSARSLTVEGHGRVIELTARKCEDECGVSSKVYDKDELEQLGVSIEVVQEHQSLSGDLGTIRGLHFQSAPYAQAKLIRVLSGSVFHAVVDIRKGSPTYGNHVTTVTSAKEGNQLLVPKGFAHGFCTLETNTEILCKVDAVNMANYERGILWNDPDLRIPWPIDAQNAIICDRDRRLPRLKALGTYFTLEQYAAWMVCDDYPTFAYLRALERVAHNQARD